MKLSKFIPSTWLQGRSLKPRTISLRTTLAGVVLLAMSSTAVLIHFPWMLVSKRNIGTIVAQLNTEIMRGTTREVGRLFSNTLATQQTVYELFAQGVVDPNNPQQRQAFYLSLLKADPNLSWVSFGYPNGDFFGAQRDETGAIRWINRRWDPATRQATRETTTLQPRLAPSPERPNLDASSLPMPELQATGTTLTQENYYAPERDWYEKAIAHPNQHVWTDVYIFSASRKLGINSAITLEQSGQLVGVVSLAIELERISAYLKGIQVAKTGTVFIINGQNELIAFPDAREVVQQSPESPNKLILKKLGDSQNTYLKIANQTLRTNGVSIQQITALRDFFYRDPETGAAYYVSFAPAQNLDWVVGTVIPEADFLEEIHRNQQRLSVVVACLILLAVCLAIVLTRKLIAEPLSALTRQTQRIKTFELEEIEPVASRIREIEQLSTAMDQMSAGLASFKRYLSIDLVRTLIQEGIVASLGGEEKKVTIFFIDLVGFTQIFEQMGNSMIPHLGEFYDRISREITQQSGTIDKYIGDCIMAFWGAPRPHPHHAIDACRAALACQDILGTLRPRWQAEGKVPFYSRIGINTGTVLVGNIGCEEKMNYTVIGDPVNVANRLEMLNKVYGTDIIIGEETYQMAQSEIIARLLDTVAVYGKEESLQIYELLAMRTQAAPDEFAWVQIFEAGLMCYRKQRWEEAIAHFNQTLELRGGNDQPAKLYLERCAAFMQHPPEADWAGVTSLANK